MNTEAVNENYICCKKLTLRYELTKPSGNPFKDCKKSWHVRCDVLLLI